MTKISLYPATFAAGAIMFIIIVLYVPRYVGTVNTIVDTATNT